MKSFNEISIKLQAYFETIGNMRITQSLLSKVSTSNKPTEKTVEQEDILRNWNASCSTNSSGGGTVSKNLVLTNLLQYDKIRIKYNSKNNIYWTCYLSFYDNNSWVLFIKYQNDTWAFDMTFQKNNAAFISDAYRWTINFIVAWNGTAWNNQTHIFYWLQIIWIKTVKQKIKIWWIPKELKDIWKGLSIITFWALEDWTRYEW